MKRTLIMAAMLLVAGASMMTGCKDEEGRAFRLVVSNDAKTSLASDYNTLWQEGDIIYINGGNALTVDASGGDQRVWATDRPAISAVGGEFYGFYGGLATLTSSSVTESAQSYTFSVPATQNYNPDNLLSPMAGAGEDGSIVTINFQNLFSLLELHVPAAFSGSATTITVTEKGTGNVPLYGTFEATYNSTTKWTASHVSGGGNTLTVNKNGSETVIYVPIPSGHHLLEIAIGDICKATQKTDQGTYYDYKQGHYYPITLTLPGTTDDTPLVPYPHGDFFFGKGNLCYRADRNPQWALEANQWEYTEFVASGSAATQSSQLSWMTSNNLHPENANNGSSVKGWLFPGGYSRLLVSDETLVNWTIPTTDQWKDLLGIGTSSPKWAYINIVDGSKTINGMLIVTSDTPISGTSVTGTNAVLGQTYSSWNVVPTMSTSVFTTLEQYGCLFLPAYGYVGHSGNSGEWTVRTDGYYRTATQAKEKSDADVMKFTPGSAPSFGQYCQNGYGVCTRLIYIPSTTSSK